MRCVGRSCFGASVLIGSDDVGASCLNANGLPSVSTSVKMIGKFQRLLALDHENICQYLDLHRCTLVANSIVLISEHYETSLYDELVKKISDLSCLEIAQQIASAMKYLHFQGICIGFFRSSTIRLYQEKNNWRVRLAQYGLRFVTNDSRLLLEPLIHDYYAAPEVLLKKKWHTTFASDLWAFGIILLELYTGKLLSKIWSFPQYSAVLKRIFLASEGKSIYSALLSAISTASPGANIVPEEIADVISICLEVIPSKRGKAKDLANKLNCSDKQAKKFKTVEEIRDDIEKLDPDWKLAQTDIDIAFLLWKLCGATPEAILAKNNHIKVQFPIMTVPILVIEDLRLFGSDELRKCYSPTDIFALSSKNLLEKLNQIDNKVFAHSVEMNGIPNGEVDLSLLVKEKDVTYQLSRSLLIRHLLNCPNQSYLKSAVRFDIPPIVRGDVWARLLGVKAGKCLNFYELDTLAPHTSDRQLDVDIPRCHQYDELMTSPSAHWKLRRLLKSWLLTHPDYVYWQGCDSLSTPFLLLHFNALPKALICLSSFVNKYLFNFFLKDNSIVIQEHLAVFYHLLSYTDAKFYATLVSMDFYPELFAIPWFLTCFAHVLPIHKLLYVWDVLLLHDSSFPLFLGLALLRQLRPRIMDSNFNDVILLFSDLPDMSMDRVISDSVMLYEKVPPSCGKRCHASDFDSISDEGEPRSLKHSLTPLSHYELKKWHCARMSPEEFTWRVLRQEIAVLDIRSATEFTRAHVTHSLNCPSNATALMSITVALTAAQKNEHPICVVGGKDLEATKQFISMLVLEQHIDGICVLDGGFESVRDCTKIIGIPE